MKTNSRVKMTKSQFISETKNYSAEYITRNSYDLNQSGGVIADIRSKK